MIQVTSKYNCCGCSACVQVCPKQCIEFNEDSHGFRYPSVYLEACIDCGLCEKVCPVINQSESHKPLEVFAAKSLSDDIRMNSSSGGIFTLIAEYIIKNGGVVFGAMFDNKWEVRHSYADTREGLKVFQGSKYVQSIIGDSFLIAKSFLDQGRLVFFTGTPCQISGLNRFLRKDYKNLITADVVCHGVPSPLIWRSYVNYIREQNLGYEITKISFRNKEKGWRKFSMQIIGQCASIRCDSKVILQEATDKNLYMQMFLNDLSLRPSCSSCPSKSGKSCSDITLADFWGIENESPEIYDNKGVSLVMLNNEKGTALFNKLQVNKVKSSYDLALKYNPCIEYSVKENKYVPLFWEKFRIGGLALASTVLKYFRLSVVDRILRRIMKILKS